MRTLSLVLVLLSLSISNFSLSAATDETPRPVPKLQQSITEHSGTFNGKKITYTVHAGDHFLYDDKQAPKANIYSTAYFANSQKAQSDPKRPLLFIFNGGPGSSSVWLHMGVFGPKRVDLPSDGEAVGAPPYNLVHNPLSLIDSADMVFIDPVGTGYSHPLGEYEGSAFWGVKEDAQIMADFVRAFTRKHNVFNRPKYLVGESYGTTRAGAMVKELQEGWGTTDLSGVMLISSIVDFQTGDFKEGNDLPYITFLPTYAATAWYHNVIDRSRFPDLPAFLNAVRGFALGEYATVLLKGNLATAADRASVLAQLHAMTGLSTAFLERANLRINEFYFMKELLRDKGVSVGRLDSRYLGKEGDLNADRFEADPSGYAIDGAYTALVNQYMRDELNVHRDVRYQILSGKVFSSWNWLYERNARSQGFLNVTPFIAKAMRQNKDFRVFVGNGYYDLATPFFATEHSMNHNGIDASRVSMKYYEAGHMMYIHQPSLQALVADIRTFLQEQ